MNETLVFFCAKVMFQTTLHFFELQLGMFLALSGGWDMKTYTSKNCYFLVNIMVYDHLKDLQCKMELTMQVGEILSTSNATIKA